MSSNGGIVFYGKDRAGALASSMERIEAKISKFDIGVRYRGPDPGGGVNIDRVGTNRYTSKTSVNHGNRSNESDPCNGVYSGNKVDYSGVKCIGELDFSRFDGSGVKNWLWKVEKFFDMDVTPEFHKIKLVSMHLDGEAATWHQSLLFLET